MRSIFRYPGGKTKKAIQRWILSHRPDGDMREYREPFVGGGGVFFAVKPSMTKSRWINDANAVVFAFYGALAERPEEFAKLCREVEPAKADDPQTEAGVRGGLAVNARLKAVFDEVKLNEDCDQAFRYFFVNRTVFGGRVNYELPSRLYFSNEDGWNIVAGNHLEIAADKLRGVRVTHSDFEPLFLEPGKRVWIYADPPYVCNTNMTPTSQLYQHGFTKEDHERLANVVRRSPHNVCLSYDDDGDGLIRSLYPKSDGFHIVESVWHYAGSTLAKKVKGKELLILNYPPPRREKGLFDLSSMTSMSTDEAGELAKCESVIQRFARSFIEMGSALRTIRDRRLYRASHKTFEEYCEQRWSLSRVHVHRLIDASTVAVAIDLLPVGNKSIPERQARELVVLRDVDGNIDSEAVVEAWGEVVEKAEQARVPITAKLVREVVQRRINGTDEEALKTDPVFRLLKGVDDLTEEQRVVFHRGYMGRSYVADMVAGETVHS